MLLDVKINSKFNKLQCSTVVFGKLKKFEIDTKFSMTNTASFLLTDSLFIFEFLLGSLFSVLTFLFLVDLHQ